jgi:hypothetical protein
MNGEFDVNGKYRFGGLHEYEKFVSTRDAGLIDPDYVIQSKTVYKPETVTEVYYKKATDLSTDADRVKSLAPKGTTEADFIEAGALLKKDFRMGTFSEITNVTHPDYESLSKFIFSKTPYMIQGRSYIIQGYRSISNPSNSSWWFIEKLPF